MKTMNMKIFMNALLFAFICAIFACSTEQPKKTTPTKETVQETSLKSEGAKEEVKSTETPKQEKPKNPTPPEHLKKAKELIASVSDDAIAAVDSKKKFKLFCAACHGFTGDLNVNGATDLTASKIGMVERVAQVYHGKGLMTPFKGILKDPEIVAVSKYLETLRK